MIVGFTTVANQYPRITNVENPCFPVQIYPWQVVEMLRQAMRAACQDSRRCLVPPER